MKPKNFTPVAQFMVAALAASCAHAPAMPSAEQAEAYFDKLAAVDVPALNTHLTPSDVTQACNAAESQADQALTAIVSAPTTQSTFESTFNAYEQAMAVYVDTTGRLGFLKDIHPDEKVRAAAAACEEAAGKYLVKVGARKDLFDALSAYVTHESKTLDAVDRRLIERKLLEFRRNGLALVEADRDKLVHIRQRLAELATAYESHLDEDTTNFATTAEQLDGLPASFIATHTADGKVTLTTKYPDYYPVMENAKSEALRRQMWIAFQSRQADKNLPLLSEAVALRDQDAKLLGYANRADFVTDDRMAKNSKTVIEFLSRVQQELVPARDALNARMLEMKRAEQHNPSARLETWDWRYYMNQIKKQDFSIDNEEVRQYFPADKVMTGMFNIYSTLFGVKFNEVAGADVWADGVKLYEVRDGLDGSGKLLAKFYVDLFPRPGKYGHAASFTFGVARALPTGYQIPLSALVVNFNPPQDGKVAHLSHEEVDVLFHEFGHIMHGALTNARYASMSGTNVDIDFVEAPSQMLENWVFQPEILAMLSEDPKNPGHPIPSDLASRLAKARTFDAGIRYTRQVYLADFDIAIHTRGAHVDPDAVEHEIRGAVTGYPTHSESHTAANFGHLMGGYDAGYYGYLWSEVFADDMFSRFEKEGLLNGKTGRAYRDEVLARGQEEEPMALLQTFLGRKPNESAFLRITGINGK